MEVYWHPLRFSCPKCNSEDVTIAEVATSADGELRIAMACPQCKILFQWKATFSRLVQQDTYADVEQSAQAFRGPLRPPIAPPALPAPDDFEDFMDGLMGDDDGQE